MKRFFNREIILIAVMIVLGLTIRSLHYSSYLNFSTDQAAHAMKSLEIWRNKEITLIGPSISFNYLSRELFTGSITYYFQLLFLLPAKFDPVIASYLFTIFSCLMAFPLYFGVKLLLNRKSALIITILYLFLPFYIDYSRFLWNPNFQLVLSPLLILCLGLYSKKKRLYSLFLAGFTAGLLLLFHYQFIIIILALFIYFVFIKKTSYRSMLLFLLGIILGFSPLIIFELRNHFYNTQTLFLYLTHFKQSFEKNKSAFPLHYFLTLSLFFFLATISFIKHKITYQQAALLFIGLFLYSFFVYNQKPSHAFGMVENWNYLDEKKAYTIIRQQNLRNFNVANLGYNTVAAVQKYLLKKDHVNINYDDYYHNRYLFVISRRQDFFSDPAYEISTFRPVRIINHWPINSVFQLYLLERT